MTHRPVVVVGCWPYVAAGGEKKVEPMNSSQEQWAPVGVVAVFHCHPEVSLQARERVASSQEQKVAERDLIAPLNHQSQRITKYQAVPSKTPTRGRSVDRAAWWLLSSRFQAGSRSWRFGRSKRPE